MPENEKYECVSPERLAQLMSLDVGFTGYVKKSNGDKVLLSVEPMFSTAELFATHPKFPTYTLLPTGEVRELGISDLNTLLGHGTSALATQESSRATYRLYKSYQSPWWKPSPHIYKESPKTGWGWGGGSRSRIKTFKIQYLGKAGKILGKFCFVVGAGFDFYDFIEGNQSLPKMLTNIAFSAAAFIPLVGWLISGVYWVGDMFLPGGWKDVPKHQYNMYMQQVNPETGVMMAPWIMMGTK